MIETDDAWLGRHSILLLLFRHCWFAAEHQVRGLQSLLEAYSNPAPSPTPRNRGERDVGELAEESAAIDLVANSIEPFIHFNAVLTHALADDVHWDLEVSERAAGDPREDSACVVACELGPGVPQEGEAAVSWYRNPAEQGLAEAQYNFGVMYANGEGVPQDYAEAHMWFNLATASRNKTQ